MSPSSLNATTPIVFGHRGQGPTSRIYEGKTLPNNVLPENSLAAFEKALNDGAEGIELDVFLTTDGHVVVSHDDILDRNVNGYYSCWGSGELSKLGKISEKTLEEIKKFDIGNNHNIPTLEEVLELVEKYNKEHGTNITINIELKQGARIGYKVAELISGKVLENKFNFDSFMINSFDDNALMAMAYATKGLSLRISKGMYTWEVYGGKDNLGRSWLPVEYENGKVLYDNGMEKLKTDIDKEAFENLVKQAKQNGCTAVDVVSSDLTESMMAICDKYKMEITATTNAIRARAQEEINNPVPPNLRKTDEEIEKQEVKKMFDLGQKYPNIKIYYKADNPGNIILYRQQLMRGKQDTVSVKVNKLR